ncbi:hypothetical protein GCM10023169_31890 [Georgenia halophila]|uniref:Transcription regulator PadR C-terminal domain-containing protein n=1 Tax=Georgenia halophila TaxID=620889 RepID=A0ABP8LIA9_9MICO
MTKARLTPTSYALLGLMTFKEAADGVTGYELKQLADLTLRFYWVAPAMSQVYSELDRLADAALVAARPNGTATRRSTRYVITPDGEQALRSWLADEPAGFPVLKHPVALRLLMGDLSSAEDLRAMLVEHLEALATRRAELQAVRHSLEGREDMTYPAMVADWGLAYFDSEVQIVQDLERRIADEG